MYITQSRSVTEILYHAKSQRRQEYKENTCVFILFIDPMYFTLMYTLLLLLFAALRDHIYSSLCALRHCEKKFFLCDLAALREK